MSNILGVDTALGGCSVAHSSGALRRITERNKQTSQLAGMVQEVMIEAGTTYNDLDAYAVTIGPGSFTGVRIGLAFIRGLALATPKPIYAINTLELLSYQAIQARAKGDVFCAINAYRGQLYAQRFLEKDNLPVAQCEPQAIEITDIPSGDFTLAGDAESFFPDHESVASTPDTTALVEYASKLPLPAVCDKPAPLYLRPPDAKAQNGDLTVAQ